MPEVVGVPEFERLTEPYRRELLAHCYRMSGALDEAEDLVQETYLRAWRAFDGFEGRSSLRVWLYRIATNVCLTALRDRGRRPLPSGLVGPSTDPEAPPAGMSGVAWLQPVPGHLVAPESEEPAAAAAARESLRLALIASLQYLPARQRAVLILREVLSFRASEVAGMLNTTTTAVKSSLQRARARLEEVAPAQDRMSEPADPERRALLAAYIKAFENSDIAALERVLRKDAALENVPAGTWFDGRETCVRFLGRVMGSPGDWKLIPTEANGQPAAVAYHRGEDGPYHAFGVAVVTVTAQGIARIVAFGDPGLVERFGHPRIHPSREAAAPR